ncbi:hypothetical protein IV203_011858 [Nitzschia inconspicua]|uniref:Uncharacterized protein n=1 Tax=Nitzschia inconspicua TaxID=303405 RepID=A0A9K3KTI2_9STRA|nr:hypothetical protein IV203_011858 [Nitzschia inconspicua]
MFSRIATSSTAKRLASGLRGSRSLVPASRQAANRTFVAWTRDPEIMQSGLTQLKATASRRYLPWLGVTAAACAVGQYYYGNEQDFFDYRFIVDADPDDLADFYGSENFMDIYCVMPFMGTLMMRGGYFDEDGTVHTTGLPGEMLVSMVFSDSESSALNDDDDDDDDENNVTKKTDGPADLTRAGQWFNKRERFKDVFLGWTMWDMVTNFGFETLPDGRTMVYHHGEYFKGNVPPVSLLVRLVFGIHARWVAWATEHHINHYAFKNATEFDEQMEHDSRVDMPLFLLKNYAWSDLMAALFGRKVEKPSFLIKKSEEEAAKLHIEEEEEEERILLDAVAEAAVLSQDHELPFQKPAIMRRITLDIHMDRENSNITLGGGEGDDEELEEDQAFPRRTTTKKTVVSMQQIPTDVALKRYATSLNRTLTRMKAEEQQLPEEGKLQRRETLGRENLGGNAAWEALRSTNNPEAYKAASIVARSKFTQRRATLRRQNSVDRGLSQAISESNKGEKPHARANE